MSSRLIVFRLSFFQVLLLSSDLVDLPALETIVLLEDSFNGDLDQSSANYVLFESWYDLGMLL